MSDFIISVDRVCKSVSDSTGTLQILQNIDFALSARETAAIVGASGSGKSTLLSIIAGLDTPTSGTVRLAGDDIFALDEDARAALRARQVGFVFQSFQLLGNLTALENAMLPLELAGRKDARKQAADMLDRVGLSQRMESYPKVLSGGEQQRVALARAFVVKPAVLLADEPTGSLDFATGETIMALMFALNRELGTTLVLVTHDPAIAARCQRRITIEAGRLASDEPLPPESRFAPLILVLDGITDPHNLGACLRVADGAGVHAVIAPKDHAAGINATVAKVASGAAQTVPYFMVTNLARTLVELKERNIWIIGTSDVATQTLYQTDLRGPVALVLGAEGDGMRQLTAKTCDQLVRIPMMGAVESLNVSVASGVCLYEALRQRSMV